jgi:hypothetical protein
MTRPILAGGFAMYRPTGPLSGLLGDRVTLLKLASRMKAKLASLDVAAGGPHLQLKESGPRRRQLATFCPCYCSR